MQANYGDVGPMLKMAVYQSDDAFPLTSAEMPAHAHNLSSDARAHALYWGMSDATVHAAAKVSAGAGGHI